MIEAVVINKTEYDILKTFFHELKEGLTSLEDQSPERIKEISHDLLQELKSVDSEVFNNAMLKQDDISDDIKKYTKVRSSSNIYIERGKNDFNK